MCVGIRVGFLLSAALAIPVKLTNEITDLKSENKNLNEKITKFETEKFELLARLERLEKVALGESKSKDLATIQLPFFKKK